MSLKPCFASNFDDPNKVRGLCKFDRRAIAWCKALAFLKPEGRRRNAAAGTVKFYNTQKGYGFITPDDGGKDVFVHVTAVEQSGINQMNEGSRISFETEPDKRGKGPKAVNLQTG